MTSLIPGKVLKPLSENTLLSEDCLILAASEEQDKILVIPTKVRRKKGRCYFAAYRTISHTKTIAAIEHDEPSIVLQAFRSRTVATLTDADLEARFEGKGGANSVAVRKLKQRWALIEPLVSGDNRSLLFDPACLAQLVNQRAKEVAVEATFKQMYADRSPLHKGQDLPSTEVRIRRVGNEIHRLLKQFWAGGSVRGALIGFSELCGGKGKRKEIGERKRGPKNAVTKQGVEGVEGLVIVAGSKHETTIKSCYKWVNRETSVARALRRMWDEFYSTAVHQPDGTVKPEWLPAHLRPTRRMFVYWGTQNSPDLGAWRRQLPPTQFDKNYRALMGSAKDDVFVVGQRGGMDSSPPDIQFVRTVDRTQRTGGGHRIILVDSMFGYIPGLYMGYAAPSGATVGLALYNAIDSDKKGWLEELGLFDIPAEDFIPIWFQNVLSDNTDVRCAHAKAMAAAIDTNLHFVPKLRSDLNPLAEASHHVLHRLVDHKMRGTTYGRSRTERGEEPAVERALHTMIESIRETVRAIWTHNTAEVGAARPLRMRLKHVEPTRLAMTRELIRQGKIVRATHAIELARNHLLPRWQGTFTEKGVRLHLPNSGNRVVFFERFRHASDHPIILQWAEAARRGGKQDPDYFRATFIVNPMRLSRIWYLDPPTGEQIELQIRPVGLNDPDAIQEMTLEDFVDAYPVDAADRSTQIEQCHRKLGSMEYEQDKTKALAAAQYDAAVRRNGGPPPKSQLRRGRRANRDAEEVETPCGAQVHVLDAQSGPATQAATTPADPEAVPESGKPAEVGSRTGASALRAALRNAAP